MGVYLSRERQNFTLRAWCVLLTLAVGAKSLVLLHAFADRIGAVGPAAQEEMLELMRQGSANRAIASTRMNQDSSRSHSLFIITTSQHDVVSQVRSDYRSCRYFRFQSCAIDCGL